MTLEEGAKQFWFASYFWRHGCGRDTSRAVSVIISIASVAPPQIATRAQALLREIEEYEQVATSSRP